MPSFFTVILIVVASIVALLVFYFIHRGLEYCYLLHARRFCKKHDFEIVRWRCGPAFDESGVKTEFTVFELDCLDVQKQRKLVRLSVWIFGIRKILSGETKPSA